MGEEGSEEGRKGWEKRAERRGRKVGKRGQRGGAERMGEEGGKGWEKDRTMERGRRERQILEEKAERRREGQRGGEKDRKGRMTARREVHRIWKVFFVSEHGIPTFS